MAGLLVGVTGGCVWAAASLAAMLHGDHLDASLREALAAAAGLPAHLADPRLAWAAAQRSALPGPALYWASTLLVVVAVAALAAVAFRRWGRSRVGTAERRPLGVDARARFARARDLAPLRVRGSAAGRFVLGVAGRALIATETQPTPGERTHRRQRRGDRGAVALVGPSRSGKTTAAIAGILEWEGPAVCSSVKADLLAPTLGWRSHQGEVRIYDPTGTTGRDCAAWSPLRHTNTVLGAQRAARALCDAATRG